jgi:rhamnosyltransferase
MSTENVCAIFLAFHPSDDDLQYVRDLSGQMNVVVVSNSGPHDFGPNVRAVHCFEKNVGVGEGYNRGLDLARSIDSTHVVFHDQDSRLQLSAVAGALVRLSELAAKHILAIISLTPVDLMTGHARQPRVTKPERIGDLLEFREVQFSGLVAPITLFEANPFSNLLFVDFVDFEWCWKVGSTVRLFRDESLTIGHCIGSGVKSRFGVEYSLPSPNRFYFQWRNLAILARGSYVPTQWKVRTAAKFVLRGVSLVILDLKRVPKYWSESVRGLRDGLAIPTDRIAN